jgi:hypothetical protein
MGWILDISFKYSYAAALPSLPAVWYLDGGTRSYFTAFKLIAIY